MKLRRLHWGSPESVSVTRGQVNQVGVAAQRAAMVVLGVGLTAVCIVSASLGQTTAAAQQVPVVFSGGHDTDPRDRGRPVVLVAGALGVAPEVFREAFSHVHPAGAGQRPDPEQVQRNKAALMDALGRYGITNDRLDTVSNYYRYVRSRGEMWPTHPASAYAVVEKGVVTRYVVTDGGSGYSSAPTITVPGFSGATAKAQLSFSKQFKHNGAVSAISISAPAAAQ